MKKGENGGLSAPAYAALSALTAMFLRACPLIALVLGPALADAQTVACHATYGGETRLIVAEPVASPYGVAATAMGSYFRLRIVFQKEPADLASIKVYTYADRDDGITPIHQATYPYPPAALPRHGFSGLQSVYEPVRDGELQYWCELRPAGEDK